MHKFKSTPESKPDIDAILADCAFKWFYHRNYNDGEDLPKYVDRALFREHMMEQFMNVYQNAYATDQPQPMSPALCQPLICEPINADAMFDYIEVPAFMLTLQKPWYDLIWSGDKTGVLCKGTEVDYGNVNGALIVIALDGDESGEHIIVARVCGVEYASSIDEQCDSGRWPAIVPQATGIDTPQGAQEAKNLLLGIYDRDGAQVFSPEAVAEAGGLSAIYFEPEYGCDRPVC